MKKILFFLLTITALSSGRLCAQSDSAIYLIGATTSFDGEYTGFDKHIGESAPFINFFIGSSGYMPIYILHFNRVNDPKAVLDLPLSELSRFNAIEVDDLITSLQSNEQAREWEDANYQKKVWIIDRNDFYKSSPSLPDNDRMKLIEAIIMTEKTPGVTIEYAD